MNLNKFIINKNTLNRLNVFINKKIHNVKDIEITHLFDNTSKYLQSVCVSYKLNGKSKQYDLIKFYNSVSVLIYNTTTKKLILVKQFRPAIYYKNIPPHLRNRPINMKKYPPSLGITRELCSGIVDKDIPEVEIAKAEVLEECGFRVPLNKFEKIHKFCAHKPVANITTMFYCEVNNNMKVSEGGGINNEAIVVEELSLEDCFKEISKDPHKNPASVLIGYYWFQHHKPQHLNSAAINTLFKFT